MASRKEQKREARERNDGRAFEALIERIEHTLAPLGSRVQRDVDEQDINGAVRQIDLVVTLPGAPPKRVAFECRDRSRASDIMWIDQCIGKYIDLHQFDRVVIVSTKRLGPTARTKADRHGIEIWTCSDLETTELLSLSGLKAYVDFDRGIITSVDITIERSADEPVPALAPELAVRVEAARAKRDYASLQLMTDASGSRPVTPDDLMRAKVYEDGWRPPAGSEERMSDSIVTVKPADVFIETTAGRRQVLAVVIEFHGFSGKEEVDLTRKKYTGVKTHHVADGRWTDTGGTQRLDLTFVETAPGQLRLRLAHHVQSAEASSD